MLRRPDNSPQAAHERSLPWPEINKYVLESCPALTTALPLHHDKAGSARTKKSSFPEAVVSLAVRPGGGFIVNSGPPGGGKSTACDEEAGLVGKLNTIGVTNKQIHRVEFDKTRSLLIEEFGSTAEWDQSYWYFLSYLILYELYVPERYEDFVNNLKVAHTKFLTLYSFHSLEEVQHRRFVNLLAEHFPEIPDNVLAIVEIPAVATQNGKDRGLLTRKVLAARLKRASRRHIPANGLFRDVVPPDKTLTRSMFTRDLATTLAALLAGVPPELQMEIIAQYANNFQRLGIHYRHYQTLEAMHNWIRIQLSAAGTHFIVSMLIEELRDAHQWLKEPEFAAIRRLQVTEYEQLLKGRTKLEPLTLYDEVSKTAVNYTLHEVALLAAYVADTAYRYGIPPEVHYVDLNVFNPRVMR